MPASSNRADPSATADASPSAAGNTAPAPNAEAMRRLSLRGGARAMQFAHRLKANAQWMMRFLHGEK